MLDKRAKGYWPGNGRGDSTILYSGHTTEEQANKILDAFLAAGCTGGHIEQHVQGFGWCIHEDDEEPSYPHSY